MAAPIDPVSFTTLKIGVIDQSGAKHPATAFLYQKNDEYYLVTNWHVVTGRNPAARANSLTGSLVTHLQAKFHFTPDSRHVDPYQSVEQTYELLDLSSMKGRWFEHSDPNVDIAILPIVMPPNALAKPLNKVDFEKDFEPTAGEDVFVVGFPRGLAVGTTTFPLWKGGSIASDPAVPIDRKSRHLIDCDTYEGMSGSPVIARRQSGLFKLSPTGGMADDSVFGEVRMFFGVYSGRVKQRTGTAETDYTITKFGTVWSGKLLDEILSTPVSGCILR